MQTEFKAGQSVWILKINQPVNTRIRAVKYVEALEISRDAKTGKETENINVSCIYSTLISPNDPMPGGKIGTSKDDLVKKIFGAPENTKTEN
jgi:hypothetical protein